MKTIKKIILTILFSGLPLFALDEYHDSFDGSNTTCGSANNWCMNFPYGRSGFLDVDHGGWENYKAGDPIGMSTSTGYSDNSVLHIKDMPSNGDLLYNNYWTGRVARLDSTYSATPEQPFGFEVIRYYSVVDPSNEKQGTSTYHRAALNIWLIENSALSSMNGPFSPTDADYQSYDFSTLPNFIYFYEFQQANQSSSRLGYFSGSENDFDITQALSPEKSVNDLNPDNTGLLFTSGSPFDGDAIGCTDPDTSNNVSYNDKNDNDTDSNPYFTENRCGRASNRKIGIRMTHDGSVVRFYLNPNPESDGGNYAGYANSWHYVGQKVVPFNTNMKVMIGQEQFYFRTENVSAIYDHYLVRPVAQSATVELTSPQYGGEIRALLGAAQEYGLKITPTMNATDAGVGEIYIQKPDAAGELFNGSNWDFNSIVVCQDNDADASSGKACNGAGEVRLTYSGNASNPSAGNFSAFSVNNDTTETLATGGQGSIAVLRFRKTSGADNQVFKQLGAGAHIRVYFTLSAANAGSEGQQFTAWVDNQKFSDTAQEFALDSNGLRYSTTHRMKASPASASALQVKIFSQPALNMAVSVSPDPLYWGDLLPFVTIELRTDAAGSGPGITRVVLQMPSEGDLAPFDFELKDGSNISSIIDSLRIPDSLETADKMMVFSGAADDLDDCTMGTYTYCYYTNSSSPAYRKLVVHYTSSYYIPGKSGYDRITFFMKAAPEFSAASQITANWSAQGDSAAYVEGTTLQAATAYNADAANTQTLVRATPAQTIAWLNTNVASNNANGANPSTVNVTYYVKNQGGASNIVKRVELLIPYESYTCDDPGPEAGTCDGTSGSTRENFETVDSGDIVSVLADGSAVSPTITIVGNETIGGNTYRVVRLDLSSSPLNSGSTLAVNMNLRYFRDTNAALAQYAIKHRSDNENYSAAPGYPYPQYTDGSENPAASWSLSFTPPEPRGEAFVFRGDKSVQTDQFLSPLVLTSEISSGDISNIHMKVLNKGGLSNNIDSVVIDIPEFFDADLGGGNYGIADVCSTYLNVLGGTSIDCASDGGNITLDHGNHKVTIDYSGAGYVLKSDQDTISGTVCPGESNVPCEIVSFTIRQNSSLANPGLSDSLYTISDGNSDGIYETVTNAGSDGNSAVRSGTFRAKLNNSSGVTSYARQKTGSTLTTMLEYPDPSLESFVTSNLAQSEVYEVDATSSTSSVKVYIKNPSELAGNDIYKVDIEFPDIVSGIPTVSSLNRETWNPTASQTELSGTDFTSAWDGAARKLTITYESGKELPPSASADFSVIDIIALSFSDTVTTSSLQALKLYGYNRVSASNTGKSAQASLYNGADPDDTYNDGSTEDNSILYQIPSGLATAVVEPAVAYTTSSSRTQQSRFYVQNTAISGTTNYIYKIQIGLPSGVTVAQASDVSTRFGAGAGVTCSGGDGFTGGCAGSSEKIEIDNSSSYSIPWLDTASNSKDVILIKWSHNLSSEDTRQFVFGFDNNDGNLYAGNQESLPASLTTVSIVAEPQIKVEVLEKTGDPQNPPSRIDNQSIAVTVPDTSYHRFKMSIAGNAGLQKLARVKIIPPSVFDVASLDAVDLLPSGTSMSISGGEWIVTFPGGKLTAATATLEFRVRENRDFNIPGTHVNAEELSWVAQADFFTDILDTNLYAYTNLPGPAFDGKINPDSTDDSIAYIAESDLSAPAALSPVSGVGDAGIAWDKTVLRNPDPSFIAYANPNEAYRINPGNPDYTWTQNIYFENQGELSNDLRIFRIKAPAVLTALAGCTDSAACTLDENSFELKKGNTGSNESGWATISTTDFTVASVESGGNFSLSAEETLLFTLAESVRIEQGETLKIAFSASHAETTTSAVNWSVFSGNYNATENILAGSDPVPFGHSAELAVVSPTYGANFVLSSVNGVAGGSSIDAASSANSFSFLLTNNSTEGDALTNLRVALPGYFDLDSATITSSRGGTVTVHEDVDQYDTSTIEGAIETTEVNTFNKDHYFEIQYAVPIPTGESDTITVTGLTDSFFSAASLTMNDRADACGLISRPETTGTFTCPGGSLSSQTSGGAVSFKASASYNTSSGGYAYIRSFPNGSNRLAMRQQPAVVQASLPVTKLTGPEAGPRTHELSLKITNGGPATRPDDRIYRAKIVIPKLSGLITSVTGVGSSVIANDAVDVSVVQSGANDYYFVYLNYENDGGLLPGISDTITFTIEEDLENNGNLSIQAFADNHSSITATGASDDNISAGNTNGWISLTDDTGLIQGTQAMGELRLTFVPEDYKAKGKIVYFVDPSVTDISRAADLEILKNNCSPSAPSLEIACDARFAGYLIDNFGSAAQTAYDNTFKITYQIKNASSNFAITQSQLDIIVAPNSLVMGSLADYFQIAGITSSKGGSVSAVSWQDTRKADGSEGTDSVNETMRFTVDYSGAGNLLKGETDTLTITLAWKNTLPSVLPAGSVDKSILSSTDAYQVDGSKGSTFDAKFSDPNKMNIQLETALTATFETGAERTAENSGQKYFHIRKAPFGRILGEVAPASRSLSFSLYTDTSGSLATAKDILNGDIAPSISVTRLGEQYGQFVFDRIPAGTAYVIKASSSDADLESEDYLKTKTEKNRWSLFTVNSNAALDLTVTLPGPYEVKYRQLSAETGGTVTAPLDGKSKIILPPGALDNSPRINIRIEETASQVWGLLSDAGAQMTGYSMPSANRATHPVYNLVNELDNGSGIEPVVENQLKGDATLVLAYDNSLISSNNWSEDSLGIHYWDFTRKKWVAIGGKVDITENTVTAEISYMHRTYTVMPLSGAGEIANVTLFPRVFTPGRTDSHYSGADPMAGGEKTFGNMKISFTLPNPVSEYRVAILDLRGRRVKLWEKDTQTGQGSVYWDGRDEAGALVPGGIYQYVVEAEGKRYRGTVVVAR